MSFPHRFGSSLNAHFHYHIVVIDGVFEEGAGGDAVFREAISLTSDHWLRLQRTVQRRVLRYFSRHGLLDEEVTRSMLDWQGSGGFSIDASVRIEGHDRAGIERLVRYCARPPFALSRLHAPDGLASLVQPDARLLYEVPARHDRAERGEVTDPHSPAVLLLTPLELLSRIARLVPPPRRHRHRYHGVLAPNARLRAQVVAIGRPDAEAAEAQAPYDAEQTPDPGAGSPGDPTGAQPGAADDVGAFSIRGSGALQEHASRSRRIRWAQLLARIFEVLPLLCPACGGSMRIISLLTDPPVVRAFLLHLELPHRPPLIAPARGPPLDPQHDFSFEQSIGSDDPGVERVPEYEYDQSTPDDWDLAPDPDMD